MAGPVSGDVCPLAELGSGELDILILDTSVRYCDSKVSRFFLGEKATHIDSMDSARNSDQNNAINR